MICIVSKNFAKTLDLKREFDVTMWRHKLLCFHTASAFEWFIGFSGSTQAMDQCCDRSNKSRYTHHLFRVEISTFTILRLFLARLTVCFNTALGTSCSKIDSNRVIASLLQSGTRVTKNRHTSGVTESSKKIVSCICMAHPIVVSFDFASIVAFFQLSHPPKCDFIVDFLACKWMETKCRWTWS